MQQPEGIDKEKYDESGISKKLEEKQKLEKLLENAPTEVKEKINRKIQKIDEEIKQEFDKLAMDEDMDKKIPLVEDEFGMIPYKDKYDKRDRKGRRRKRGKRGRYDRKDIIDEKMEMLKLDEKDDIQLIKKREIDKKIEYGNQELKLFKSGIYPELNNLNGLLVNLNDKEKTKLFTMIKNHYLYNSPELSDYLKKVEINNLTNLVHFILNLDNVCNNNKRLINVTLNRLNKLNKLNKDISIESSKKKKKPVNKNIDYCQVRKFGEPIKNRDKYFCQIRNPNKNSKYCQIRKKKGSIKNREQYFCQIRKKKLKKKQLKKKKAIKIKNKKQKKINKQKNIKKQIKKQVKKKRKKTNKSWFNVF